MVRRTRLAFTGGAGLFLLIAIPLAQASAEGFFDSLFGGSHVDQPWVFVPRPTGASPPVARVRAAPSPRERRSGAPFRESFRSHAPALRAAVARPTAVARYTEPETPHRYIAPPVGDGPLGPFLYDPTLRRGDVLVTEMGLRVFRSAPRDSHRATDFVALAHSSVRGRPQYRQLALIDDNNARFARGGVETRPALTAVVAVNGSIAPALTVHPSRDPR